MEVVLLKKMFSLLLSICLLVLCAASPAHAETAGSGNIFLYGETHADPDCLEKELSAWADHYAGGVRDLFIEVPFYSAEYLNLWMHSDTDELLDFFYDALEGTQTHDPCVLDFYRKIKSGFPETVFHGTDVGHQYSTLGAAYLTLLESEGRKDSEEYRLAEEIIQQGITYYTMQAESAGSAYAYREKLMVDNFLRLYASMGQKDIMGIYGSAHTYLFFPDSTGSVPCMATQLKALLGDCVHSINLTKPVLRSDTVTLGGRQYQASYFGSADISWAEGYLTRDFWCVENAYEDLKDSPRTDYYLPADNYIMEISAGEVYIVEYKKTDGSLDRQYYLADGSTFSDWILNTYRIIPNE